MLGQNGCQEAKKAKKTKKTKKTKLCLQNVHALHVNYKKIDLHALGAINKITYIRGPLPAFLRCDNMATLSSIKWAVDLILYET